MSQNPSDMTDESTNNKSALSQLSRRKLLGAGSATLAGGLAGCGGDGGGDSPTRPPSRSPRRETVVKTVEGEERTVVEEKTVKVTRSEAPPEYRETSLDTNVNAPPLDIEMGWGGTTGGFGDFYNAKLGQLGFDGNYKYEALTDIGFEGNNMILKLRDDLTYHNGDPVTIDAAIYHQQQLYWAVYDHDAGEGWAGGTLTHEPEALDDYTARYQYKNPGLENLELAYFSFSLSYPTPMELAINEDLREANEKEQGEILDNRVSVPNEQDSLEWKVKESPGGTGPYTIESWDDVSEEGILMKRYDGSPFVDEDFPEEFRYHFAGGSAAREQLIINDVADFGGGAFPQNLETVKPRALGQLVTFPKPRGTAMHFSYADKDLANRGVRRAVLSALDLGNVRAAAKDRVLPHTYQLGMTDTLSDNYLGEDFVNNRIKYPLGADTAKATSYMQNAGYTKVGDKWVDPDGNETNFTFVVHSNKAVVGRAIADPLKNFGFNVELLSIGNPNYNDRVRQQKDYDMVLWSPYGCFSNAPHPWCFYRVDKHTNLALGGGASGPDWGNADELSDLEEGVAYKMKDGEAVSIGNEHPLFPTIPSEHGQEEISGSGQEVNLLEIDNHLEAGEDVQKWSRVGAHYYNFDLPNVVLWENTGGAWGDVQNFDWPAQDDPTWIRANPVDDMIREGRVSMIEK